MPDTKKGMQSIETQVPKKWVEKIEHLKDKKGMTSRRQYLRGLVYDRLKKEGELWRYNYYRVKYKVEQ